MTALSPTTQLTVSLSTEGPRYFLTLLALPRVLRADEEPAQTVPVEMTLRFAAIENRHARIVVPAQTLRATLRLGQAATVQVDEQVSSAAKGSETIALVSSGDGASWTLVPAATEPPDVIEVIAPARGSTGEEAPVRSLTPRALRGVAIETRSESSLMSASIDISSADVDSNRTAVIPTRIGKARRILFHPQDGRYEIVRDNGDVSTIRQPSVTVPDRGPEFSAGASVVVGWDENGGLVYATLLVPLDALSRYLAPLGRAIAEYEIEADRRKMSSNSVTTHGSTTTTLIDEGFENIQTLLYPTGSTFPGAIPSGWSRQNTTKDRWGATGPQLIDCGVFNNDWALPTYAGNAMWSAGGGRAGGVDEPCNGNSPGYWYDSDVHAILRAPQISAVPASCTTRSVSFVYRLSVEGSCLSSRCDYLSLQFYDTSTASRTEVWWSQTSSNSWGSVQATGRKDRGHYELHFVSDSTFQNQGAFVDNFKITETTTVPDGPGWSVTAASSSQIDVTWTAVSGATWYRVTNASGSVVCETNTPNCSINGLSSNTQYCFQLTVGNECGSTTSSTAKCATTSSASCSSYSLSSTSASPSSSAGSTQVTVTGAPQGCVGTWSAQSNSQWLTVSPASGNSGATASVSWSQNTGDARTGTLTLGGQTFTVNQGAAPSCTFSLSPASSSPTYAGGQQQVTVNGSPAGCRGNWSASANVAWLSVSPASGAPGASTSVDWTQNPGSARSGTATIGGQTFSVNQGAAPACTFSLSPVSASPTASAGQQSVTVSGSPSGCQGTWSATSNAAWLTVTPGSGSPGGSTTVSWSTNAGDARTGTATIGGQTFTVNQSPATCQYSIASTSASPNYFAGQQQVTVNASPASCTWGVSSNANWLSVSGGGSGNGTATVSWTENSGSARSGTVTIAGQTFTVNQGPAPSPCTFTISPSSASPSSDAGQQQVQVTASGGGCAWDTVSSANWLSASPSSGTGSGATTISWTQNPGNARSATVTIGGQTFSVNQDPETGGCTPTPISCPYNAGGALTGSDCAETARGAGFYGDIYTLSASLGTSLVVDLQSAQFDTWVILVAPDGTVAAQDDDSGDGTNSYLTHVAQQSGTYQVVVTSWASGHTGSYTLAIQGCGTGPTGRFNLVTPCRLVDTRSGVPLAGAGVVTIVAGGQCGIPSDATAVALNVTAVSPPLDGWLSLYPAATAWPGTSTLNFRPNKTRANNAIVRLSPDGRIEVRNGGSAATHFLIDVSGYFR
jgi:hypothetical protein